MQGVVVDNDGDGAVVDGVAIGINEGQGIAEFDCFDRNFGDGGVELEGFYDLADEGTGFALQDRFAHGGDFFRPGDRRLDRGEGFGGAARPMSEAQKHAAR